MEVKSVSKQFPVDVYAIPEILMMRSPEHDLPGKRIPCETGVVRYREIIFGQIFGDDGGLGKLLFQREGRRRLGVHAIGTGATKLIHAVRRCSISVGRWTISCPKFSTIRCWLNLTGELRWVPTINWP